MSREFAWTMFSPKRVAPKQHLCALAIVGFLLSMPAVARTWSDPPFAEMVEKSDLIVLAEVFDPGDLNRCTVRVTATLKGVSVARLGVGGFNDRQGRSRMLKQGERFLLFLRKPGAALEAFGSLSGPGAGVYTQPPPKDFFVLPTPSSGDFPIDARGIRGNPFVSSWPEDQGRASERIVIEVVRAFADGDTQPSSLLSSQLDGLGDRLRSLDARDTVARSNALWLLFAAARLGDNGRAAEEAGRVAARHHDPQIALAGIRLLRSRGGPPSLPVLLRVVNDDDASPHVRGEAALAAQAFGALPSELGPAIARALRNATTNVDYEGPLQFWSATSSVEQLLHAAMRAKVIPYLERILVERAAEIVWAPRGSAEIMAMALLELKSDDARENVIAAFERTAIDRHNYAPARLLLLDGHPSSVEAVVRKLQLRPDFADDVAPMLEDFAFAFPEHPQLPSILETQLRTDDPEDFFGAALVSGDDRTRAILEKLDVGDAKPLLRGVLRALNAKRTLQGRALVKELVELLAARSGLEFFIKRAVLFEIVRATPRGDEAAVVALIRAATTTGGAFGVGEDLQARALLALGATLTPEEQEARPRNERRLAGPFAVR